jgi:outer membrane protein
MKGRCKMKTKSTNYILVAFTMIVLVLGSNILNAQDGPKKDDETAAVNNSAATGSCKVGFVNLGKVLEESQKGKNLRASIDSEREKAMAPLKARKSELDKLEEQMKTLENEIRTKSQLWDPYTQKSKQLAMQNLQVSYQSIIQELQLEKSKIASDLDKKKNELLRPLEDTLNQVMEEVGKKDNYCLILDVTPPSPAMPAFSPIIYRNPAFDITDEVIKAVDK